MESYCEQINVLAASYRVIAMDTRGHGRSTDNDQPYSYTLFASDVDALLTQLGIPSATLVGIGDGANTALQVAMTYPKRVEKLVVAGANLTADSKAVSENILRSVRAANAQSLDSAVVRFYTRFNDNPKNFPVFFEKMKRLLLNHPNLTGEELKSIQAPTLVISGDHDFILLNNTVKIFKSIPKSYLCVVPGAEHYVFQQNSGFINEVVLDFLKKEFVPLKKY
jgi:pimeloyl-ACP methyl ester carboxylesterase